jgi:hypothetical protein
VILLEAAVIGISLYEDSQEADVGDAGKAAAKWASAHKRPGETFTTESCSAISASPTSDHWAEFGCPVRFHPSGRAFVVYLRAVNGYKDVKLVKVLKGANHQLVPIPRS